MQTKNMEEHTMVGVQSAAQLEQGLWLKEIAFQLAVMNERAERTTPDNSSPEVLVVDNLTSN